MKKIISVILILTTLLSVGSMCSANSVSQEGESAVVGDLAIVTESGSLENNSAGLFTELFAAVWCVGWLMYKVVIPAGVLVLAGGALIYAAVTDSKGK